jgi:formamidopyrimidine-DNA glycosylase
MPEIPDLTVYLDALARDAVGRRLERVRLASPFLLRTVEPKLSELEGRRLLGLRRMGKRLVFELEGGDFLVLHLMIAGRLKWLERGAALPRRLGLAAFDFGSGTLLLTEAGSKKRAALHAVRGDDALAAFERGGLEVQQASETEFVEALRRENRTLKRALTDPRILSGIGNAYSDEILHRARLSPVQLTRNLSDAELARLFECARSTLDEWTARLRVEAGEGWPKKVTAFREAMAVHGRHGEPCPDCATAVQRIVHAENETNYCPRCQTGGRLLKDRALSQLLRQDWPRTIDELESLRGPDGNGPA